jgi:hypothetical protein
MNPDLFNYSENVIGYRYSGNKWKKMDTSLQSQGASYYAFESITKGNSILNFGNYRPKIRLGQLKHRDELLDNETLNLEIPVENKWRGKGEITVNYTLNGSNSKQKTVEVEGEGNKTVEFKENGLEPGNYTITVNDRKSEFEVQLRDLKYRILDRLPFNNLMMLYALIGLLLALPIILIGYREREKIEPYIEPVRSKFSPLILKIPLISSESSEESNDSEFEDGDTEEELDMSEESTEKSSNKEQKGNGEKIAAENSGLEPNEEDLKCDECGRSFNSREGLKMHKSKVHSNKDEEDGDYLCAICGESFDTSTGLELHHKKFHESD